MRRALFAARKHSPPALSCELLAILSPREYGRIRCTKFKLPKDGLTDCFRALKAVLPEQPLDGLLFS
jgi:hypothetical protein